MFFAGCGDGRPSRVPVGGSVLIDGAPLKYGSIMFVPRDGSRSAGGSIDTDGNYRVSTFTAYDGLPVGTYDVTVAAIQPISETKQSWHAPKRYANVDTSGIAIEINGETDGLVIELTWEGDKHSKPFIEKVE